MGCFHDDLTGYLSPVSGVTCNLKFYKNPIRLRAFQFLYKKSTFSVKIALLGFVAYLVPLGVRSVSVKRSKKNILVSSLKAALKPLYPEARFFEKTILQN